MSRTYDDLVQEAATASVDGWDFSWLDGRASEERPSWGYARLLGERMAGAGAALDVQTGGGEILAGVPELPAVTVATESWPPNLKLAASRLRPRGAWVVADDDDPRLPFRDGVFDLVTSRHPVETWWEEIARVLRPGGAYFSQQVGPWSVAELTHYFMGPHDGSSRDPDRARAAAGSAGLEVVDLRFERLRMEFCDVGAVIYFLRKVIWIVPGFSVERYADRLRELHDRIEAEGPFVAHSSRFLIEARKPGGPAA
ncbi:class I SAM-dependent methyltransferase [Nonomuraea sp. NPDC003201]